ncbi:MAG TPA: DUF1385 domain-containing protein [Fimbriimonadaceae bacterium]|nr:DUF1385 domain-containing protein [Fimbriimonadaceae bacterium]
MTLSPLSQPISHLMRPTFMLGPESTLGGVADKLRENSAGVVPIVNGRELIGVVSERSLAHAIAMGAEPTDGVEKAFETELLSIPLYESGAEALRMFETFQCGALAVVDDTRRVLGILRASDLIDPPEVSVRPALIGGMATPFGVYLTSGTVQAGAKGWALVATGATLFTVLTTSSIASNYLFQWLVEHGWQLRAADWISSILLFGLFAVGFRLMPISGIHAAEHMVVHTMERGEPLIPSVVKRMPRVHPRCGTNLAVGASIFMGIAANSMIQPESLRLTLALVATLTLWRKVGGWVQYWITTRPPSDRHIEMGIRSAKELLEMQSQARVIQVGFLRRLWNSGIFHVMIGSTLAASVLAGISAVFHLDLPL